MPDFFQDGLEEDDRGGKESRFHEVHLYTKIVHESVYKTIVGTIYYAISAEDATGS